MKGRLSIELGPIPVYYSAGPYDQSPTYYAEVTYRVVSLTSESFHVATYSTDPVVEALAEACERGFRNRSHEDVLGLLASVVDSTLQGSVDGAGRSWDLASVSMKVHGANTPTGYRVQHPAVYHLEPEYRMEAPSLDWPIKRYSEH